VPGAGAAQRRKARLGGREKSRKNDSIYPEIRGGCRKRPIFSMRMMWVAGSTPRQPLTLPAAAPECAEPPAWGRRLSWSGGEPWVGRGGRLLLPAADAPPAAPEAPPRRAV